MFDLIDLYVKRGNRWQYLDCSRMFRTLKAASAHYSNMIGEPVKSKFANPRG